MPKTYLAEYDKDPVYHPMLKESDLVFPIEGDYWYISDAYELHVTGDVPDFGNPSQQPWADYRRFIRKIIVHEGVKTIGNYAFFFPTGTSNVKKIFLNSSVETIGNYAFAGHSNLGVLYDPDVYSPNYKVDDQGNAVDAFIGLEYVKTIGNNAFQDCSAVKRVNLGISIQTLGDYVFKNCPLQQVYVMNEPATISKYTFAGIADNGQNGIINCYVWPEDYSLQLTYPLTAYWKELHYIMDDDLEIWYQGNMYGGNFILTSDSVMHIWPEKGETAICPYYEKNGMAAARDVINWNEEKATSTKVNFGANDKVADKIKKIKVTGEPTYLGGIGCFLPNLKEIALPESVERLTCSFFGCEQLKEVSIPNVKYLGYSSNYYGSSMNSNGVRVTMKGTFAHCPDLEEVYAPSLLLASDSSFCRCPKLDDGFWQYNAPDTIQDYAFKDCTSFRYLNLSHTTSVSGGSFAGCTNLYSVDMGNNVPLYNMFKDCKNLQYVYMDDMIGMIGLHAFENCPIREIWITTPNPPQFDTWGSQTVKERIFGESGLGDIKVYTYADFVSHYEQAEGWKEMQIDVPADFAEIAGLPIAGRTLQAQERPPFKWEIQSDGQFILSCEGKMHEIELNPKISYTSQYITSVVFNKGIIEVNPVMYNYGYKFNWNIIDGAPNLKTVYIPSTMEKMTGNLFGTAGVYSPSKSTNHTITDVYCYAEKPVDISYSLQAFSEMSSHETAFGTMYEYHSTADAEEKNEAMGEYRIPRLHVLHKDGVKAAYEAADGYKYAFVEILDDLTEDGAIFVPKQYTVTFVDMDDTWITTAIVEEGKAATAPSDPVRKGYTFAGWDTGFDNVTEDLTVRAKYEAETFTVTLNAEHGKIEVTPSDIDLTAVPYGTKLTVTAVPDEDYVFTAWGDANTNATREITVEFHTVLTAKFALRQYTVTFLDWNAVKLYEEQVEKGKDAKGPDENPTREGYVFTGWEPDIKNITADRTVIAQYEQSKVYFTVTYLDWNAIKLYEEKVEEGHDAKGPDENPTREGYVFTGWEPDIKNITADRTVIAQYKKKDATGLDDLQGADDKTARKVLRNGVLYILRGGKTYSIQGALVE